MHKCSELCIINTKCEPMINQMYKNQDVEEKTKLCLPVNV